MCKSRLISRHNDRRKILLPFGDSSLNLWAILASAVIFNHNFKPIDAGLANCLVQAGNNLASKLQSMVSGNPNEQTIHYGPADYLSQISNHGSETGQIGQLGRWWNWWRRDGTYVVRPTIKSYFKQRLGYGYSYPMDYANQQQSEPHNILFSTKMNAPLLVGPTAYQKSAIQIGPIYPWYSSMMAASAPQARFLGSGTAERMFTGAVRLMCQFNSDESLYQPTMPTSRVEWTKLIWTSNGVSVNLPQHCASEPCQLRDVIVDNDLRFRAQDMTTLNDGHGHTLTIDNFKSPYDNGYYRCLTRKLNNLGQMETLYRLVHVEY